MKNRATEVAPARHAKAAERPHACAPLSIAGQVPAGLPAKPGLGKTWTSQARPHLPQDHLFKTGQSGNPAGRPRGARNQSTIAAELLLDDEAAAITRKCIDLAMEGEPTALRLCLSRILPARRERSISLDLPALEGSKDSLMAVARVLEAVGSGAITPSEGQAVASLLETHRRTFEVEELEQRVEALEAQQCAAR